MSNVNNISKMGAKDKNLRLICSTPEQNNNSPSRDSDSLYDSDATSPVPFLCTQDGADGETDVVWNFYTPKADRNKIHDKNATPIGRKAKRIQRPKLIDKHISKRRALRSTQKRTELFNDLIELNENLSELIKKNPKESGVKTHSGSEEDLFSDSSDYSPKSGRKTKHNCLRKNVLSSKFTKPENENVIESDDSMNECLIKASQIVEDIAFDDEVTPPKVNPAKRKYVDVKTNYNSMDTLLGNVKLGSPIVNKVKKSEMPCINNDSFDNLVENLNDSVFEQLTQMPVKMDETNKTGSSWKVKEVIVHNASPKSLSFIRHSTMPESPSLNVNKPSTSGMVFGRYNTMPTEKNISSGESDCSPIKCTQEEIERKHRLAREKLLAKRLLPFTSMQTKQQSQSQKNLKINSHSEPNFIYQSAKMLPNTKNNVGRSVETNPIKSQEVNNLPTEKLNENVLLKQNITKFQPKFPSNNANKVDTVTNKSNDLKELLERKRLEALMKLRKRQQQNK